MKKRVSMNNSVLNSDSGSTSTSARACQHYKKKTLLVYTTGPEIDKSGTRIPAALQRHQQEYESNARRRPSV